MRRTAARGNRHRQDRHRGTIAAAAFSGGKIDPTPFCPWRESIPQAQV